MDELGTSAPQDGLGTLALCNLVVLTKGEPRRASPGRGDSKRDASVAIGARGRPAPGKSVEGAGAGGSREHGHSPLEPPPLDLHRIAPHEEVVPDAASLRVRLAETDEAVIEAALEAHALGAAHLPRQAEPDKPAPRPSVTAGALEASEDALASHRTKAETSGRVGDASGPSGGLPETEPAPRPAAPSPSLLLLLAALGLALGTAFALAGC